MIKQWKILQRTQNQLDRLQLVALAVLMFIGTMFVYSATTANDVAGAQWYDQIWFRQIIWYGLGLGAAAALPGGLSHAGALVVCGLLGNDYLLVAVLIPYIGTTHGWGARRWIDLRALPVSTSEFAKLAFILAAANFLSRPPDELRQPRNFLEGYRHDVAAVRVDFEGAGSGFGARAVADRSGDDVRRRHAETISAARWAP